MRPPTRPIRCVWLDSDELRLRPVENMSIFLRRRGRGWYGAASMTAATATFTTLWFSTTSMQSQRRRLSISSSSFGVFEGKEVTRFRLSNGHGVEASLITYGATLLSFRCPDRNGNIEEVTINYDRLEDVVAGDKYYGATCGRVANRVANGQFTLDGTTYTLAVNNGPNSLHGGIRGFDKVVWNTETIVEDEHHVSVTLKYVSPDGEEGYPGTLTAKLTVSLTDDNALVFDYECFTDKATPLNITNHTYWNLSGSARRSILAHEAKLFAKHYTPADETAIPIGTIDPVSDLPYDLTTRTQLIENVPHGDGFGQPGIDHNFVIDRESEDEGDLVPAAELYDEESGRLMIVETTEPGIQCYTMNWASTDLEDHPHTQHNAICFEAQHYPNSCNTPAFPSTILRPGSVYRQKTVHHFLVE